MVARYHMELLINKTDLDGSLHCVLYVSPSHNTQITCQLWANYDCDYDCAILPPDIKYTVNSVSISPCSPVMDVLNLLFLSTRLY